MDIEQVEQEAATDEQVYELTLNDKNGKPYASDSPVMQVVGRFSKAYKENDRVLTDLSVADQRRGQKWPRDRYSVAAVAAGVTGWRNLKIGGVVPKFSPAGALEILSRVPWWAEQVDRAIAEHDSFFVKPSSDS